jgi:hypothetical protein
MKKTALLGMVASLLAFGAPQANATIFSGACAIGLTFQFSRPVTAIPSTVSYDVSSSAPAGLTLSNGSCLTDTNPLQPFRPTSASGSGEAVSWSCEAVVGFGSWQQSFNPDPPPMEGVHSIHGTWGNWTMVVRNSALNYTGEMALTVDPFDAAKAAQCASGGISSLRMVGVMHFQDPTL